MNESETEVKVFFSIDSSSIREILVLFSYERLSNTILRVRVKLFELDLQNSDHKRCHETTECNMCH